MQQPKMVEEARAAYETYRSLMEEVSQPPRARAIQPGSQPSLDFPSEDLQWLAATLRVILQEKPDTRSQEGSSASPQHPRQANPRQPAQQRSSNTSSDGWQRRPLKNAQCFACSEWGHYSDQCPYKEKEGASPSQDTQVKSAVPHQGN